MGAGAMAVRSKLNMPFQEVLSFWGAIATRDVTSHLGVEDAAVPSTYREVFANPTMLAAWGALFANPAALSGAPIIYPDSASPSPAQLQPLNGIAAALGLSSTDISAVLAASGAANCTAPSHSCIASPAARVIALIAINASASARRALTSATACKWNVSTAPPAWTRATRSWTRSARCGG